MNILFTSAGRRGYLIDFFRSSLNGNCKIHIFNILEYTNARVKGDVFVIPPTIADPEYIPFVLNYCKKNKIDLLIPLLDIDLYLLSNYHNEFNNNGTLLYSSNHELISKTLDKASDLYIKLNSIINYPKTISIEEDIISKEEEIEQIGFPILIKPRYGWGSIANLKARDMFELRQLIPAAKKLIECSYISGLSRINPKMHNQLILQEFIYGQEFNFDIINSLAGDFVYNIPKQKYIIRSGETESCKMYKSTSLTQIARDISSYLRHSGILDCDLIFKEGSHKAYLIDLNPRFGGGYPFSHYAGIDYPSFLLEEIKSGKLNLNYLNYQGGDVYSKYTSIVQI